MPRPKAIPEEIKFDVRVLASAIVVLAVDDPGFRRMHLQTAFRQTSSKLRLEGFCFLLATAVHQSIICIPTPWEIRVCPCHPGIKRIVEKEVGQIGLTIPPCGVPQFRSIVVPSSFTMGALSHLSIYISARYVFPNGPQQELVVDVVE